MTKEQLILDIMKDYEKDGEPISREEAEEIAEMEIKAKGLSNYTQSDKPKAKGKKPRKVDEDKKAILEKVAASLVEMGFSPTMENEVALHFGEYTLKLTKHRPPK